ncbi:sce7726 family protein [Rahnella sp. SAP-1]|uniref:Sce7726 family protein n=1 Tax=Rouxiella aceris TaxID=2703884 RepID=A0A848ML64_9GAMM|nr:sce7726 family protein [Rouxiella aceris]NMP29127.1 sce7726 family protein [Rouxiella aceris]
MVGFIEYDGVFMFSVEKKRVDSRVLAQLFTSQAINKIADGDLSFLYRILNDFLTPRTPNLRVAQVFELAFSKLLTDYKTEYFFKNAIANKLYLGRHSAREATMLSEFRVGSNKADCVIVNGHTTCYEIKTKFDSLKRLQDQLSAYIKIFEKVYVVCDGCHINNVLSCIPDEVGVIEFTVRGALKEIKKAKINNHEIDREVLIGSLRKPEYVYMAESLTNKPVTTSNMNTYSQCLDIFNQASSKELRVLFKHVLKMNRKADSIFVSKLPPSLINTAISFKLSKSKKLAFGEILTQAINKDRKCTFHL